LITSAVSHRKPCICWDSQKAFVFRATTKGTPVYATDLSVFIHEWRSILVQSCRDCKIERHVLDATVLGN